MLCMLCECACTHVLVHVGRRASMCVIVYNYISIDAYICEYIFSCMQLSAFMHVCVCLMKLYNTCVKK